MKVYIVVLLTSDGAGGERAHVDSVWYNRDSANNELEKTKNWFLAEFDETIDGYVVTKEIEDTLDDGT